MKKEDIRKANTLVDEIDKCTRDIDYFEQLIAFCAPKNMTERERGFKLKKTYKLITAFKLETFPWAAGRSEDTIDLPLDTLPAVCITVQAYLIEKREALKAELENL